MTANRGYLASRPLPGKEVQPFLRFVQGSNYWLTFLRISGQSIYFRDVFRQFFDTADASTWARRPPCAAPKVHFEYHPPYLRQIRLLPSRKLSLS